VFKDSRLRVFKDSGLRVFKDSRLRVFKDSGLIKIFGPKTGEVTGDCRRLHSELPDLYSCPNISQVHMRWI